MFSMTKAIVAAATSIGFAVSVAAPAFAAPPPPAKPAPVNATVNQYNIYNTAAASGNESASIQDNAFKTASGNIGLNVAAGNLNQQANISYVDAGSPGFVFTGKYTQVTANEDSGAMLDGGNNATVKGNAFSTAKGNIGMNEAAGTQNSQLNGLMVAENQTQVANMSIGQLLTDTSAIVSGGNSASFQDNAFKNATGNIGANVASGNLNQQANGSVISLASAGDSDLYGATFSIDQGTLANFALNCESGADAATIKNNAFSNASGNIGANLSAGNANQQANALVVTP